MHSFLHCSFMISEGENGTSCLLSYLKELRGGGHVLICRWLCHYSGQRLRLHAVHPTNRLYHTTAANHHFQHFAEHGRQNIQTFQSPFHENQLIVWKSSLSWDYDILWKWDEKACGRQRPPPTSHLHDETVRSGRRGCAESLGAHL